MKVAAKDLGSAAAALDLEPRFRKLRWWNLIVGLVLAAQAVVIAVLQNGFTIPVVATWMNGPPGTAPETHLIGGFKLGWGVFAFMALSALALLLMASPGVFGWYKRNLAAQPQLRALDRVLHHLVAHDRAHHAHLRGRRPGGHPGHLRRERLP